MDVDHILSTGILCLEMIIILCLEMIIKKKDKEIADLKESLRWVIIEADEWYSANVDEQTTIKSEKMRLANGKSKMKIEFYDKETGDLVDNQSSYYADSNGDVVIFELEYDDYYWKIIDNLGWRIKDENI